MIRQHYLQQQRLGENHGRLLDRYQRLLAPTTAQFNAFGTSQLPGRNYEQMFRANGDRKRYDGMSLATLSRNGIGTKNETYEWTVRPNVESLPNNIESIIQHNRRHVPPLVQADKFEPVQMYEHPVFGQTPAYLRPIVDGDRNDDDMISISSRQSEQDEIEQSSQIIKSPKPVTKNVGNQDNNPDEDDDDNSGVPRGYISYKKWKAKYENLIPVDPLMYNIYTHRPNGSVHRYGQSIYNSYNRRYEKQRPDHDIDRLSPTLSDVSSTESEKPTGGTSVASKREYHKLKPKLFNKSDPFSLSGYVPPDELKQVSDDERSQPPLSSLSISQPGPQLNTSNSSSNLASLLPTTTNAGNLSRTDTQAHSIAGGPRTNDNTALNSTIPAAPPLPASLLSTSSAPTYQTPPSLSITSTNVVPPSTNNSVGVYQTPSSFANNVTATGPKAVTFGATSNNNNNDDVSSSSDSDDDSETRRKKRRKKRRAAGLPEENESSSSDD